MPALWARNIAVQLMNADGIVAAGVELFRVVVPAMAGAQVPGARTASPFVAEWLTQSIAKLPPPKFMGIIRQY
jgi:hypothetical protein